MMGEGTCVPPPRLGALCVAESAVGGGQCGSFSWFREWHLGGWRWPWELPLGLGDRMVPRAWGRVWLGMGPQDGGGAGEAVDMELVEELVACLF